MLLDVLRKTLNAACTWESLDKVVLMSFLSLCQRYKGLSLSQSSRSMTRCSTFLLAGHIYCIEVAQWICSSCEYIFSKWQCSVTNLITFLIFPRLNERSKVICLERAHEVCSSLNLRYSFTYSCALSEHIRANLDWIHSTEFEVYKFSTLNPNQTIVIKQSGFYLIQRLGSCLWNGK